MKKFLLLIFLGWACFAWCQGDIDALLKISNAHSIPYISVTEARMLQLQENAILLDARETDEFEVSHLPGALHIGYNNVSNETLKTIVPNKDKNIVVYCSVGVRSEDMAERLKKLGYHNVRNLYGGIFKWFDSNYPVVDQKGDKTQRVHTYSKQWAPYLQKGIKVN